MGILNGDGQRSKSACVTRYSEQIDSLLEIRHSVFPGLSAEHENVQARAPCQHVVPGAAFDNVVIVASIQHIPPISAFQDIISGTACQDIGAKPTVQLIVAHVAEQAVSGHTTGYDVIPVPAHDLSVDLGRPEREIAVVAIAELHVSCDMTRVQDPAIIRRLINDDMAFYRATIVQAQSNVICENCSNAAGDSAFVPNDDFIFETSDMYPEIRTGNRSVIAHNPVGMDNLNPGIARQRSGISKTKPLKHNHFQGVTLVGMVDELTLIFQSEISAV